MELMDAVLKSVRSVPETRPSFFPDPMSDRLLDMIMALTAELAVTRERLETVERLLESKSVLARAEVDAYDPPGEVAQARLTESEALAARVLRTLHQDLAAMENGAPAAKPDWKE
jgi:hypothetical protein